MSNLIDIENVYDKILYLFMMFFKKIFRKLRIKVIFLV